MSKKYFDTFLKYFYFKITLSNRSSTLLFKYLPSSVSLVAIGSVSPLPVIDDTSKSLLRPYSDKYLYTILALLSDNF